MTIGERLVGVLKRPLLWVASVIGTVAHVVGLHWIDPALFQWLLSSSSYWFGGAAVFATTIAPEIRWIPTDPVMSVFLGMAGVYVVFMVYRATDAAAKKLRES